ncbi:heme ABC exporter ATP-binding protein CcmA [Halovulum dunhuangense]|uniref:Heme ABC exporter ATP-binding protein CcmA n=1 Tax=Halovulum dunhuangense TaxID=1505036 RepID=A0A849L3R9_9RHOB|nr:heme ABC exporter ATP-binding protein CcmA [Halovulum dunhuangense]NNU81006.1 heme ABC exporter ATP-binding protein CcmA [Halovulum dunhuangense]
MTLDARDLECRRGASSLFEPVSFTLAPGHALLLQGPNGAGKTTLLRAMAGLGQLFAGSITLNGTPLHQVEGALAYTGHLDAIKPALSVAENIGFWAALSGIGEIAPALAAFGLTGLAERPAGRLSAGQKRRLGLARLAVSAAPVWLLDEPTVSLDAENTAALGALVTRHLDAGGIAIIATHLPVPVKADVLRLVPRAAGAQPQADPFLDGAFA